MTEPITDYTRHLWTTRFARYTDAELREVLEQAGNPPSAIDELAFAEIERRWLGF